MKRTRNYLVVLIGMTSLAWSLLSHAEDFQSKNGLKAAYFKGSPENLFAQPASISVDQAIKFDDLVPKLAKKTNGSSDQTAVRWTGGLRFPTAGEYRLHLIGDNGFRLWLDQEQLIDFWVDEWDKEQISAPFSVSRGEVKSLRIEYFNAVGGASLRLSWSRDGGEKQIVPNECYLLPDPLVVKDDLRFYLQDAIEKQKSVTAGTRVGTFPATAVKEYRSVVTRAETVLNTSDVTETQIRGAIASLQQAQVDLSNSIIKEPFDGLGNGNPVVPGYWADPSIFYDEASAMFYIFATVDGVEAGWQHDTHFARSKNVLDWEFLPLALPKEWRLPKEGHALAVWAPTIMKHPSNGKYYLAYFIEGKTYVAYADSPSGPWANATTGTTPETSHLCNAFDAQFFVDRDGSSYLCYAASEFKLSALNFAADFTVSIDNQAPEATEGQDYRYKTIHRIDVFGEGTVLYEKDGIYYLFYSELGSQNYRVAYATASSVWGPYTQQSGRIMQRDSARDILGPGHVSIFEYGGDTYIGYHRQHFPFVDSKRQTCVNRLTFDGVEVEIDVQDHAGLRSGRGALERRVAKALADRDTNLALGMPTLASSVSDFKGGTYIGESFRRIPNFYQSRYAVDDNLGTRWTAAVEEDTPSEFLVDLGSDTPIGRTEILFEHVRRLHRYQIDYLADEGVSELFDASKSDRWQSYVDRSKNTQKQSPLIDRNEVTARYLRLRLLSANLPTQRESNNPSQTDFLNRIGVVEFRVFGPSEKEE